MASGENTKMKQTVKAAIQRFLPKSNVKCNFISASVFSSPVGSLIILLTLSETSFIQLHRDFYNDLCNFYHKSPKAKDGSQLSSIKTFLDAKNVPDDNPRKYMQLCDFSKENDDGHRYFDLKEIYY